MMVLSAFILLTLCMGTLNGVIHAAFFVPRIQTDSSSSISFWNSIHSNSEKSEAIETVSNVMTTKRNPVQYEVKTTGKSCNKNNTGKEIIIRWTHQTEPVIKICFDDKMLSTNWTSHYLVPLSVQGNSIVENTKFGDYMFNGTIKMDDLYKQTNLTKGHLAPRGDFQGAERLLTYYYVNIAPQEGNLNSGAWKTLEETIRKLVKITGPLLIYTGTFASQKYLGNQTVNIPRYFWKIVVDETQGSAMTFIGFNEEKEDKTNFVDKEIKCKDICTENGWILSNKVLCCDLNLFLETAKIKGIDLNLFSSQKTRIMSIINIAME